MIVCGQIFCPVEIGHYVFRTKMEKIGKLELIQLLLYLLFRMHMGPYISSTQGTLFRKNGKPCHDQMTRSCEVVEY